MDRENLQSIADRLLSHLAPPDPTALPSAIASLQAISNSSHHPKAVNPSAVSLTPAYRLLLTQRLLGIVSANTYANVIDFEWVISLLVDISYISKVDVNVTIRDMLLDVVGRVRDVREYAVGVLEKVLGDEDVRHREGSGEADVGILEAAVWICGEYSR